jgi:hypothetical protein
MPIRFQSLTGLVAFLFSSTILIPINRPVLADELTAPRVSLILGQPTAERHEKEIWFRCPVTLNNATGKELSVRSQFFSVFDGLDIVITTMDGKTLDQVPYLRHQSPFSLEGREFKVKTGTTSKTLLFPVRDLPEGHKTVKVRLVGKLPECTFRRILSTETFEVKLDP